MNVLVIGIGEYVTGFVDQQASKSDKPIGVVALSLFHIRQSTQMLKKIILAGTSGKKFAGIKEHFDQRIKQVYSDIQNIEFEHFPQDAQTSNAEAYKQALELLQPGDLVMVFSPDHLHFEMAMAAVKKNCHVLVAKPLVQTLAHHLELAKEANARNVLCCVEVHKRWDPMYSDARDKIQKQVGDFSYFTSYMSQPTSQVETFSSWISHSDISYYLNSHHVDFHCWSIAMPKDDNIANQVLWRPTHVTAMASKSVHQVTEDSITLMVQWSNGKQTGTGVYTSSFAAPTKAEVHSQQRFFYQGSGGEVQIDQAHRGYTMSLANQGLKNVNPLFMKYSPNVKKQFAGQFGYGYQSIKTFCDTAHLINSKQATMVDAQEWHANAAHISTQLTSAILEAGRISLNEQNRPVHIVYNDKMEPVALK